MTTVNPSVYIYIGMSVNQSVYMYVQKSEGKEGQNHRPRLIAYPLLSLHGTRMYPTIRIGR
jgi:hypothetical protein